MNLTVGPLSPAVYWRRRAVVLGVVLLLVILLVSMCGGSGNANKQGASSARTTGSASPTPSQSSQPPIIGGSNPGAGGPGGGGSGSPGPTAGATAPAGPAATGAVSVDPQLCTDAEIQLTPSVHAVPGGTYPYRIDLKIKNASARSCKRDVGAGPQEMHITDSAGRILWSSDYCQSGAGSDLRTFGPNIESPFSLNWDGDGDAAGCVKNAQLGPGSYRVVAKLGTKLSEPVPFTIAAASGVGS
jgi:hypothetical protein